MNKYIQEYKKLTKNKKELDDIFNVIFEINKKINKVYFKMFYKKKTHPENFFDIIFEITEFSDLFQELFMSEGEEDLTSDCGNKKLGFYNFTKEDFFEKCVEIWNGYPPFIDFSENIKESMESDLENIENIENLVEIKEDNKKQLSTKQQKEVNDLLNKCYSMKGNKHFVLITSEMFVELDVPKFVKKEDAVFLKNALEGFLVEFMISENSTLLGIIQHPNTSNELFGIINDNSTWNPLPKDLLENVYPLYLNFVGEEQEEPKYLMLKK